MKTTAIKFFWNGIKLNGEKKLIRCFYFLDNTDRTPCVSISCRDYSGSLPGDLCAVQNDTDVYTDYFDADRATLTPEHPLYPYARAAAIKAATRNEPAYIERLRASLDAPERWPGHNDGRRAELDRREARLQTLAAELATLPKGHPTADDLAAVEAMNCAAETARLAEEEAQRQAEREKVLSQRNEGRAYIHETAEAYPIQSGAPVVRICWSEHPAFYSWDDNELTLSVAAAEIILSHYDRQASQEQNSGYYKTKFLIEYTGEDGQPRTYEGRYDLGDNDGGLVAHVRAFGKFLQEHGSVGERQSLEAAQEEADQVLALADLLERHTEAGQIVGVTWAPWLTEAAARRRQDVRDIFDAVAMLTDEQLESAIFMIPPSDKDREDVARFFLQELSRRDESKALETFRRWRAAG